MSLGGNAPQPPLRLMSHRLTLLTTQWYFYLSEKKKRNPGLTTEPLEYCTKQSPAPLYGTAFP
jgi:hypothetical protein